MFTFSVIHCRFLAIAAFFTAAWGGEEMLTECGGPDGSTSCPNANFVDDSFMQLKTAATLARTDYKGYYWKSWLSETHLSGATVGVCFNGWADATKALNDCKTKYSKLKGDKWISIGGGNENGKITKTALETLKSKASTINATYKGVMIDIEEVSGTTSEIKTATKAATKALSDANLAVGITTSLSGPYTCTGCTAADLVDDWLSDSNVDVISPQLYAADGVVYNNGTTAGIAWSKYDSQTNIAWSIAKSSHYATAKKEFTKITPIGYFVWGW